MLKYYGSSLFSLNPYTYTCNVDEVIGGHEIGSRCVKMEKSKFQKKNKNNVQGLDLNGCKMTCGKYGALWPQPTGRVNLSTTLFDIFPNNIAFEMHPKEMSVQQEHNLGMIY